MEHHRMVLVVDDDSRVLAFYSRALRRYRGVTVHPAADLATARTVYERFRPDICLVDLCMPDGSGIDFIREARLLDRRPQLVLVTGYGCMEVGAGAVRAGADAVYAKPLSATEIGNIVERRLPNEMRAVDSPSAEKAQWEHIHRVLADCQGNKSLAARKLRIHRVTLQRWLKRAAPTR